MKGKYFILHTLLLTFVFPIIIWGQTEEDVKKAQQYLQTGTEAYQRGEFSAAI